MTLESDLQAQIIARVGALPGVLVWVNKVGKTQDANRMRNGSEGWFEYGLGKGTPDLIGCIDGRMFGIECKVKGREKAHPERVALQTKCRKMLQARGAFACVVTSPDEMVAAIARCRAGESE